MKEKSKRKSLLKRIATSAVAVACMFSLAQPFGSVLKAEAIYPDPVSTTPMDVQGFPSTDEVVTQAAQLLGAPYKWGEKGCDLTTLYSTNKTLYSAATTKSKGVDCSGLVFWTLATMGYYTEGFAAGNAWANSPVPYDTNGWFTASPTYPSPKKIGYKNGTVDIPPVEVTYQKSVSVPSSQPSDKTKWWQMSNGETIAEGSIVMGQDPNANPNEDHSHAWIYIGEFANKDAVVNYLHNVCGVDTEIAEANTYDETGDTHWRIEATNREINGKKIGVAVTNSFSTGKSTTGAFNVNSFKFTQQKGNLVINKKIKPVEGGEFAADSNHTTRYSEIKFALKVKNVEGLTAGKYVQLTKVKDGEYTVDSTPALLDSATENGAEAAVGANGTIKIQNLEAGTYTLVETTKITFLNNAEEQDVVITKDNTTNAASYEVINEQKRGNVEVIKYSADIDNTRDPEINANVLENATFIIENTTETAERRYVNATGSNGDYAFHGMYGAKGSATEFKLAKVDENGRFIVRNLPMYNEDGETLAKYKITETKTDSKFVISNATVDVQFANHNETVTKEIVNVKAPTSFDVTKEFILGTVGAGQASDKMYGEIKFVVKNSAGKYLVMDGSAANGYTFNSYTDSEASATVMNLDKTTHKATLGGLREDTYTVVEKVDVAKYVAKQGTVDVQSTVDGANVAKLINNELTGGFEVRKTTESMKNISGIKFRITGTTVTGRTVDTTTSGTDESGYLKVTGIPYGTYTITELANNNNDEYYIFPEPQSITINQPFNEDTSVKEFKNELRSGKVAFEKKNPSGMKLAGFEFTIYAEEDIYEGDQIAENLLYSKGDAIEVMTTGENGEGETSAVLPYNYKYKLAETKAVAPYNNDSEPVIFTLVEVDRQSAYVVDGQDGTANEPLNMLTFTNSQQQGKLTIYKIDAKDNKTFLSGAEFDVIANDDILVDGEVKFKKGETVAHGATGNDGVATFELYTGYKYSLKETKAPEGYTLNSDLTEIDMSYEPNLLYTETEVSIKNSEVPKTGNNVSATPVIFAGIGAVVALGAIIIIARKKKSTK